MLAKGIKSQDFTHKAEAIKGELPCIKRPWRHTVTSGALVKCRVHDAPQKEDFFICCCCCCYSWKGMAFYNPRREDEDYQETWRRDSSVGRPSLGSLVNQHQWLSLSWRTRTASKQQHLGSSSLKMTIITKKREGPCLRWRRCWQDRWYIVSTRTFL